MVAVLVRFGVQAYTRTTYEDAFISLRYAENCAAGLGLVYNPGERVFGASTPLYVLWLALLSWCRLPALEVSRCFAAAADGVTLYLWLRWLGGRPWRSDAAAVVPDPDPSRPQSDQDLGWSRTDRLVGAAPGVLFALLFALNPVLVIVSTSGMETSFALLCLTQAFLCQWERRPFQMGLALGVLTLLRPDGLLAAALLLVPGFLRDRRVPWQVLGGLGLVTLPWVVFATCYFGTPVPHSIPAKLAAYNLHRSGWLPNLRPIAGMFAPVSGPTARQWLHVATLPLFLIGLLRAFRRPRVQPLATLSVGWIAYLLFPRTLIFTWYYPPLLLPACLLIAIGLGSVSDRRGQVRWLVLLTPVWCALALGVWLGWSSARASQVQRAESRVRHAMGDWLRAHTAPGARIAAEPIGYIGYYCRRRMLDEVGLVSPEMVPLVRAGAGWFGRMLREFRPDYVVERTYFLASNQTINSGVPMFTSVAEAAAFRRDYEPVVCFGASELPPALLYHYHFQIFRRRW